jgi:glycosyltransferase involved in cell wall biosynthesis
MKVLVLTTCVPFIRGGAEILRDSLVSQLREAHIDAEAISIPFTWNPPERLIEEMLIARSLRLTNIDRVIALKFPAYLVPFEKKVIWLLHQYRQAYDLYDAGQSSLSQTSRGGAIRDMIHHADDIAFSGAEAIFTSSPVTRERLSRYNGFDSQVLPAPLEDPALFTGGESRGYVLATGRVGEGKRQHLLVRALRYAPGVRLIIAGPPESPRDSDWLQRIIREEGLEDRVTLDMRFLPRSELAVLVNHSLAVACLPFDEDSVSYVAMEAFQARKPVLTVNDAGGVLEIVKDNETGWVTEPTAMALGAALIAIAADPIRAARFGAAGRNLLDERGITWRQTIDRLLS